MVSPSNCLKRSISPRRYGDGRLQGAKPGVKSWVLRWRRDGRECAMGLGPIHTVNLDEARERARKVRQQLLDRRSIRSTPGRPNGTPPRWRPRSMTFRRRLRLFRRAREELAQRETSRRVSPRRCRHFRLPYRQTASRGGGHLVCAALLEADLGYKNRAASRVRAGSRACWTGRRSGYPDRRQPGALAGTLV